MGTIKSRSIKIQIKEPPKQKPQPDYVIKTRSPKPTLMWAKNLLLGKREDDFRDQSMVIARRKCYDDIIPFIQCGKSQGVFWSVFNCHQHLHHMNSCLEHQFNVQMDKRRRDMKRNKENWWRQYYNQDGQIGEQAKWDGKGWFMQSIKDYLKS